MPETKPRIRVRPTRPEDFATIHALSRRVYPHDDPWEHSQLASHIEVFPEGQLVAEDLATKQVVGCASSLIVNWEDYDLHSTYRDFTANFMFTNHDPEGRTLYAAEVMVDPRRQRQGIGRRLYDARRKVVRDFNLKRIRAGARLRGYGSYAHLFPPEEYVMRVIRGWLNDPTLSFQLRQGFRVLGIVEDYLRRDPDSVNTAAVIEWINYRVASKEDYAKRDPKFRKPRKRETITSER